MTVREILKLSRFHAAGAVWIVPLSGALAQGGRAIDPLFLLQLLVISVAAYVFGVVTNEIVDLPFDKKNRSVSTKPLVSGTVPMSTAIGLVLFSGAVGACAVFLFWGLFPLLVYLLCTIMGMMYNFLGKKVCGADVFIALWAASLCFLGALAVSGPYSITPLAYVLGAMWFFRLMFSNSVSGGLKDIESDRKNRGRTIPIGLGVRVRKGRMRYTGIWWVYELGLEVCFAGAILLPMYMGMVEYSALQTVLIVIFIGIMALTLPHISPRILDEPSREKIKRFTYLREAMGFGIMGIMLLGVAGWERAALMLFVPLLWFAIWVRLIYRSRLPTI
ncbi:MAG: UbiA family prenyltransferase [Thermoplasmata archaeon]|nr:UbiA family prenyltransferase [Thermoplasmata archaeon]